MIEESNTGRDIRHLASELRRWVRIVAGFARPRGRRNLFVSHQQYENLHGRLLATCRQIANTADAAKRPQFQRLERLLQPWVSLETLRATNRQILRDLVINCQVIEGDLTGHRTRAWSWVAMPLALFVVAALISFVWMQDLDFDAALGVRNELQNWCYRIIHEAKQASPQKKAFVLVGIFLVFSIQLLRRTRTD